MKLLIAFLSILCAASARAEWCQSVMLPESNNTGGAISLPANDPGGFTYQIRYAPPASATRVGLEFWHHQFSKDAPPDTLYYLVYINRSRDGKNARRILWASNSGAEAGTGMPVNFGMSTWLHSDERLEVVSVNNSGVPQSGYLIVTLRECYP